VGVVAVGAAAEGLPGLVGELQTTVEAVAGVGGPVAAALTLGDCVPDAAGRGALRGGAGAHGCGRACHGDTGDAAAGGRTLQDLGVLGRVEHGDWGFLPRSFRGFVVEAARRSGWHLVGAVLMYVNCQN